LAKRTDEEFPTMLQATNTLYAFEPDAFDETHDLSLCMDEPAMDPENPVVTGGRPERPLDGKICYTASVETLGTGYGMWYQGEDTEGRLTRRLAVSSDGFIWEQRGVICEGLLNTVGNSFNVYRDGDRYLAPLTALGNEAGAAPAYRGLVPDDVPDQRRRRMTENAIAKTGRDGVVTFVGVATSADGETWSLPPVTPRLPMKLETPWIYRFGGRYLMSAQTNGSWFDPPHPTKRIVVFFESEDLIHWDTAPECMTNTAHESIHGQTHVGIVPIKRIDDRMLLGLGGRFDDGHELTDQHFEITLLYSYDGLHWMPVAPDHERRSWIRRGRRGEWDFGGVAAMGMVEHGDEAAVYYNGTSVGNACHTQPLYDPGSCQVGRVRFRRDRFAALQPEVGWKTINAAMAGTVVSGTVTTREITRSPDRPLRLNIEIPDDSAARVVVDVLAQDGGLIESADVTRGGVRAEVPLRRDTARRPVRLRITLKGGPAPDRVPRLFAIEY
jgi:uncharacterized protein (DUF1330 family)